MNYNISEYDFKNYVIGSGWPAYKSISIQEMTDAVYGRNGAGENTQNVNFPNRTNNNMRNGVNNYNGINDDMNNYNGINNDMQNDMNNYNSINDNMQNGANNYNNINDNMQNDMNNYNGINNDILNGVNDNNGINNSTRRQINNNIRNGVRYSTPIGNYTDTTPLYDTMPGRSFVTAPDNCNILPRESRLVKELYNQLNKKLYPYVVRVLDEYEYADSPIYDESGIDRETLAQLVSRVIELAESEMDEAQEIMLSALQAASWSEKDLFNSLIQSLLLNEIFITRRPRYRQARGNYVYTNGIYSGIKAQ